MFRLRNQRLLAEGVATAFGGVDPQSLDRRSRLERQRGAPVGASAPRTPRRVDAQPSYAESDLGGGSC
jgi:hypothetical protein